MDRIINSLENSPGIVLYTLVDQSLADELEKACREHGCPCLSILDPVLGLFQSYLGAASDQKPGAQHVLNSEYFKRIDALNYTMMHDDGQMPDDLETADVILVGISRTSKTPTSMYLATRGIKTANYPLVPEIMIPPNLLKVKKPLVVGLIVAMFQAATQINESTLTFVPKIIVIGLVLLLMGPTMLQQFLDYFQDLIKEIPVLIG